MFISVPDIPHRTAPSFSWLSLRFHPNGNQGHSGKGRDPRRDGSTAPLHTHHRHQKPRLHVSLGKLTGPGLRFNLPPGKCTNPVNSLFMALKFR